MLDINPELPFQILRIGVVLSVAVFATNVLLRVTKASPRTRVLAWLMVLFPSWLLFSFSFEIPWYESNLSQLQDPVFSIASVHHLDNQLDVYSANLVNPDSSSQLEGTGSVLFLALIATWAAGLVVIAGWNIYGFLKLSTAMKMLSTPTNSAWLDEFDRVFEASQLRRKPYLKVSNQIGPLVCHSNRNFTIVIPSSFWNECSSEQRIAILQHEFAHIERRDLRTLLLGRIFALPQWFNPLAWFALRRLDEAIEMACDDHVLKKSPEIKFVYVRSLLALVEFNQSEAIPALSAARPPVSDRVQRILQPQGIEMKFTKIFTLFVLVSFSIITLLRLELVAQEPQVPKLSNSVEPLVESSGNIENESVFPNDLAPDELKQVTDNDKRILRSYPVGDFIVPLTDEKKISLFKTGEAPITARDRAAITARSFKEVIDLIKDTVRSGSWETGCTVEPCVKTLSLLVKQDRRGHDEIQDLFAKLRELHEVVIQLESHIVVVDKSSSLNAGSSNEATSAKDLERKISSADGVHVSSALPIKVGLNGQAISFACQDLGHYLIEPLYLQMLISADRRAVNIIRSPRHPRLSFRVNEEDLQKSPDKLPKESQEENKRIAERSDEQKPAILNVMEVVNEGYATFDITKMLVSGNDNGNQKAFLYVRPTISDLSSD